MDPDDQDAALAYRRYRASLCPECGTRHEDWFDDDGDLLWPPKLEAFAHDCEGCRAIARRRKELPSAVGQADADSGAWKVTLAPYDPGRSDVVTSQHSTGETS